MMYVCAAHIKQNKRENILRADGVEVQHRHGNEK